MHRLVSTIEKKRVDYKIRGKTTNKKKKIITKRNLLKTEIIHENNTIKLERENRMKTKRNFEKDKQVSELRKATYRRVI